MALFSRKKENIGNFANELCEKLAQNYPAKMDVNSQTLVSEKKLSEILETVFTEAEGFKKENKLGLIGKARLINSFQWGLKDRGYTDKFIKIAVEGITVYTNRKP